MVQLSHLYMTTGKATALTIWTFVGKVISLLFNTLSRFAIAFLPRSKCHLILWLQSPSAVIFEPKEIKSALISTFLPSICYEVIASDAMILVFLKLSFKSQLFYSPLFHFLLSPSKDFLVPLHFLPLECFHLHIVVDISPGNLDSSLWAIQSSISNDVLRIQVK